MVYTHWHNDHPQGASEIRAAWPGVRIISTAATARTLRGARMLRYISLRPDERMETLFLNQAAGSIAERAGAAAQSAARRGDPGALGAEWSATSRQRMVDFRGTYLVLPTETFTRELLLDDPVRPVRLIHPGRANTDGDAIAWLPNERIVVTGDIVVSPDAVRLLQLPRRLAAGARPDPRARISAPSSPAMASRRPTGPISTG